jgi:hypothetical protein
LRREFWWIWEADDEGQLRCWAPARVEKFKAGLHRVLAYLRWPARGRHRLCTTNLSVG